MLIFWNYERETHCFFFFSGQAIALGVAARGPALLVAMLRLRRRRRHKRKFNKGPVRILDQWSLHRLRLLFDQKERRAVLTVLDPLAGENQSTKVRRGKPCVKAVVVVAAEMAIRPHLAMDRRPLALVPRLIGAAAVAAAAAKEQIGTPAALNILVPVAT